MATSKTPRRECGLTTCLAIATAAVLLVAGCATRTPAPVVDRPAVPPRSPSPPAASVPVPVPETSALPATPRSPEPDWRPPSYTVKRGDTLYQIALEHGLDYRELANWNAIENANVIRVGQVLRLTAPGSDPPASSAPGAAAGATAAGTVTAPLRTLPPVGSAPPPHAPGTSAAAAPASSPRVSDATIKSTPRAIKEPWSEQAMKDVARAGTAGDPAPVVAKAEPAARAAATSAQATTMGSTPAATSSPGAGASPPAAGASPGDDEGLDWVWPAKGKLVAQYSESASLKGIDIAGSAGDTVVASAPGKVVYAGTGLRGYGKLVIVKHNNTYLTAYAHNREIHVKEGQSVARGQKIAEMGSTDADQVKLHFEIRRLGRPMDPLRFLPPA